MSHQGYNKKSGGTGGAGGGGGGVAPAAQSGGAHKKESNAEMAKLLDTAVRVKCLGGRELRGTLRGYDDLINLVLDDCDEFIRGTHSGMTVVVVV
jgi:U6 snRNA-associated Sm-like protein LSm7